MSDAQSGRKLYLVLCEDNNELKILNCGTKEYAFLVGDEQNHATEITPEELELILGVLWSREMDLKEHLARGYDMKEAIKEVQNTFDKFKKIREDSLKKP